MEVTCVELGTDFAGRQVDSVLLRVEGDGGVGEVTQNVEGVDVDVSTGGHLDDRHWDGADQLLDVVPVDVQGLFKNPEIHRPPKTHRNGL